MNNIKITNLSTPLGFIFLFSPSLRMLLLDIGSTIFLTTVLWEKFITWHPQDVAHIRHMEAHGELFHLKKTLLTRLGSRGVLDGCAPCFGLPCLPLQALQELLPGKTAKLN